MKHNLAKVPCGAPVLEAAKIMRERRIGSVFVEQRGRIVGIVTEADVVRKVVADCHCPQNVLVQDVMSSPVIGIDATRPLTDAADLMDRNQTRHLAVMRSGDIVGVLSVRDLLRPVAIDEF
jgi:CBS domain-containing protein